MSRRLNLPDSASVATPAPDGKLFAPSAARNRDAIVALVARVAPPRGRALELASGTGQHVVALAARLPGLDWQPSDADPARLDSIAAHAAEAGLPNLRAPVPLDATEPGWAADHGGQDLILLVNLLHLVSTPEARWLVTEAARALAPGGRLVIYGPFRRGGVLTSPGDASFHASLTAQDPEIGYKDDTEMQDWLTGAGLTLRETVEMPANNLAFVAQADRAEG